MTETTLVVTATVEVPKVPNFLRMKHGDNTVPVSALTDDELRDIGRLWTEALIANAARQRSQGAE